MIMIVVNDTTDQTYNTVEVSVLSNFNSGYMHYLKEMKFLLLARIQSLKE